MGNTRGMMAGLGEALSTVGKMSLADQIEQQKESRLEKVRLEAESRADARQLQAEGRADERALGAETRAEKRARESEERRNARADVEHDQRTQAEKEADERRARLQRENDAAKAEQDRKSKEHERSLENDGTPKVDKVVIPPNDMGEGGGILMFDKSGKSPTTFFDPKTMRISPVGSQQDNAAPSIPPEADALARSLAKQKVESQAGTWSTDSTDFAKYGGNRQAAEAAYYNQFLPQALQENGYDPAQYGQGVLSAASKPPPAAPGNSAAPSTPVASPQSGSLPPAVASRLREGVRTKFGNGQVWTLKGGKPTRVE